MEDVTTERSQEPSGTTLDSRRLNWGCGEHPEPGWINSDIKDGPGIDLSCDHRAGSPRRSLTRASSPSMLAAHEA